MTNKSIEDAIKEISFLMQDRGEVIFIPPTWIWVPGKGMCPPEEGEQNDKED